MKKLIFVLGLGLLFAACGDDAKDKVSAPAVVEETVNVVEVEEKAESTQEAQTEENESTSESTETQVDEK